MVAGKSFPVAEGTVVTVSCEEGYQLIGDSEVTCSQETDTLFDHSDEPQCGKCLHDFSVVDYGDQLCEICSCYFMLNALQMISPR